jgi:hypothetical protein
MTEHDGGRGHPTSRPAEPPINIHMDGDHVIIRAVGPFDHDATHALAEVITVTVTTGSVAIIALTDRSAVTAAGPASPTCPTRRGRLVEPIATAIEAGLLRLATASAPWIVDVTARKLCRSATVTDRRFAPPQAWRAIASISVSPHAVVAITTEGDHLVTVPALEPAGTRR